jgi:hypothetical protein
MLIIFILVATVYFCTTLVVGLGNMRNIALNMVASAVWHLVVGLDYCLLKVIKFLSQGRDFIARYEVAVREHRDTVVVDLVQKWMEDKLDECDRYVHGCARAVHLVISKVGLRPRNPMAVESIQRAIRDNLLAMKRKDLGLIGWSEDEELYDISDISYWSEVGTQFYFNPPYHVKAGMDVLPGFH